MKIYQELGDRIDRAYERANRDEEAFPRIAAEALREARIPERTSAEEVLAWVFGAGALPAQDDLAEAFGEPPITVYRGRDFRVEVLFWLRTVTSVHRHGFSGAFQALAGDRLQTRHAFEVKERVNAHLFLGDLRLVAAEMLRPGDVVEITNDLAHALVHLTDPSATIVVRTVSDACAGPQLDYRAPFVAIDPFFVDELRARKLQALRLLFRLGRDEAVARAAELSHSDLATCLGALDQAYRTLGTERRIAEVIAAAIERHGAARTEALMAVLREERRLRAVQALRGQTKDADQRFFLSLLHHLPSQADVLPLVRARFPGEDPLERIEALAAALTGVRRIGVDFGDAPSRALVGAMLRESSAAGVRKRLAEVFDAADVDAQSEAIERHAERIRGTVMAPLFRGLPGAAKGKAR